MRDNHLRFSSAILRLIGEELNPSMDQGILELIKNAYDADADECVVELEGVDKAGGSVTIRDDGCGMTLEEIRNGWLVVGNSLKKGASRSPGGRLLVGNKGLGRVAALRLGRKATLVSRPKDDPDVELEVEIDWERFESTEIVEEVRIDIVERERQLGARNGAEIKIEFLPVGWKKTEVKRLARSILLLTDPFEPSSSFRAILKTPEFDDVARLASAGYLSEPDYFLDAALDDAGFVTAIVRDQNHDVLFKGEHEDISKKEGRGPYRAPAARFKLWEFLLGGDSIRFKSFGKGQIREWLEQFGGVRLYHRGMCVSAFGGIGNDWLGLNLRRARSPELRPSTNNSSGAVWVKDEANLLQQKTDRTGFVQSPEFDELCAFAGDVLDWMASERVKIREKVREAEKKKVAKGKEEAGRHLEDVLDGLPSEEKNAVARAVEDFKRAHEAEIGLLNETAQRYYTLGTIGTTSAAFAHQTKHPLGVIVSDANALEDWLGDPDEFAFFRKESSDAANRIKAEADAIYAFANVTLKLLEHEKRRAMTQPLHELIRDAAALLRPYIDARSATIEFDFAPEDPKVTCTRASFEAIITNFITNSLQAFVAAGESGIENGARTILFRTRVQKNRIELSIMDNGPGLNNIAPADVWLPGKTTTRRGTGLGLAIVQDVVTDLGGNVSALACGELGGASFFIYLPLKK